MEQAMDCAEAELLTVGDVVGLAGPVSYARDVSYQRDGRVELVAAMLRPAASSLAADTANSSALAAKDRTWAADTGLVRPGSGTVRSPELLCVEAVHDSTVPGDLGPQVAAARDLRSGLVDAHFEYLDGVAGEPSDVAAPPLEGLGPVLVVFVDAGGSDHHDVYVAVGLRLAARERSEDDHAHRWVKERRGKSPDLVEHGVGGSGEGEDGAGCDVLGH